jgi:hypothetical protein
MKKDEKRSAYTKRMMEIMSSIKKQRDEIDKVISIMERKMNESRPQSYHTIKGLKFPLEQA